MDSTTDASRNGSMSSGRFLKKANPLGYAESKGRKNARKRLKRGEAELRSFCTKKDVPNESGEV